MKTRDEATRLGGRARWLLPGAGIVLLLAGLSIGLPAPGFADSVIVQATSTERAAELVAAAGGTVTHELGVIRSVAAELDDAHRLRLASAPGVLRIWDNGTAELTGKPATPPRGPGGGVMAETYYPTHLGADLLHAEGIDGEGVTIAVIDSSIFEDNGLTRDPFGNDRVLRFYNPATGRETRGNEPEDSNIDRFGHGAHVTSIAVSSRKTHAGTYNGMAPNADLVVIEAFDKTGTSSYATVIQGIDWVVTNKDSYGIRVLNCSFSAEPQSWYWDDPLAQAIMAAWRAGIVVVASAGNRGPDAMTIGVPGNVPYVITVGAMTDNYTPENYDDDILASFSSAGPTFEGFVKPEVVAPGGHVKGLMRHDAQIAQDHPEFHDGGYYFNMSGTSQAAAFVSGTVALMLQANPSLTPDEVKHRLMATADRASFAGGSPTYSLFQQGAGRIDAWEATMATVSGTANRGLDIDLDLLGLQHYRGPADAYERKGKNGGYVFFIRDADGNPIEDDGYLWSDQYAFQDGFTWSDGYTWSDGLLWSDGMLWSDGLIWSDGMLWSDLYAEALFTESWVPQE